MWCLMCDRYLDKIDQQRNTSNDESNFCKAHRAAIHWFDCMVHRSQRNLWTDFDYYFQARQHCWHLAMVSGYLCPYLRRWSWYLLSKWLQFANSMHLSNFRQPNLKQSLYCLKCWWHRCSVDSSCYCRLHHSDLD